MNCTDRADASEASEDEKNAALAPLRVMALNLSAALYPLRRLARKEKALFGEEAAKSAEIVDSFLQKNAFVDDTTRQHLREVEMEGVREGKAVLLRD